jgi:hypothetical protein
MKQQGIKFTAIYGEAFNTNIVRLAYNYLSVPDQTGVSPKFNVTGLIPKDNLDDIRLLKMHCDKVSPDISQYPFTDESGQLKDGDLKEYPGFEGNYYFKASTNASTGLNAEGNSVLYNPIKFAKADLEKKCIVPATAADFYDGCFVILNVTPAMTRKGLCSFYLNGIIFIKDGPVIKSAPKTIDDLFGSIFNNVALEAPSNSINTLIAPKVETVVTPVIMEKKSVIDSLISTDTKQKSKTAQSQLDALLGK